jgi:hypothetical protein
MRAVDFVAWAQGYYGPYPKGQHEDVANYLRSISPEVLDELRLLVRAACPSHIDQVNGYPPDIAGMAKLEDAAQHKAEVKARAAQFIEGTRYLSSRPSSESENYEDPMKLDWEEVALGGMRRAEELRREHELLGVESQKDGCWRVGG